VPFWRVRAQANGWYVLGPQGFGSCYYVLPAIELVRRGGGSGGEGRGDDVTAPFVLAYNLRFSGALELEAMRRARLEQLRQLVGGGLGVWGFLGGGGG
jgi:hypothetical protein